MKDYDYEETDYVACLGDFVIVLMAPELGPGQVTRILTDCEGAEVTWAGVDTGTFVQERLKFLSKGCLRCGNQVANYHDCTGAF